MMIIMKMRMPLYWTRSLGAPSPLDQILSESLKCPPQVTKLTLDNARLEEEKQALHGDLEALRQYDGDECRKLRDELDRCRDRVDYLEQLVVKYDKDLARRVRLPGSPAKVGRSGRRPGRDEAKNL